MICLYCPCYSALLGQATMGAWRFGPPFDFDLFIAKSTITYNQENWRTRQLAFWFDRKKNSQESRTVSQIIKEAVAKDTMDNLAALKWLRCVQNAMVCGLNGGGLEIWSREKTNAALAAGDLPGPQTQF